MTDSPDVHTLSGAYAVGAVDDDEAAAFEAHLDGCAECREEVRGMRETLVLLADATAVAPPAALRERVLAGIADQSRSGQSRSDRAPDDRSDRIVHLGDRAPRSGDGRPGHRTRTPWMVAAATAAVLALGTGSFAWTEHRAAEAAEAAAQASRTEVDQARRQVEQAERGVQSAEQGLQSHQAQLAVLTNPSATRLDGQVTGGGQVQVVLADGQAVVVARQMPALPSGRIYQLWLVGGDGITSAGLGPGGQDAAGRWTRLVEQVDAGQAVALSIEPDGGSPQPTTTPLVAVQT